MSKLILLKVDEDINKRIVKTSKKNGFKSKTDWIRWAIARQLSTSETAEKTIEGTAIDENGIQSLPSYVREIEPFPVIDLPEKKKELPEFVFFMADGSERREIGNDVKEAMKKLNITDDDILDWNESI